MRRIAYTTVGLSSFHRLAAGTAESCGHGPLSKAAPSAATALSSSMSQEACGRARFPVMSKKSGPAVPRMPLQNII